MITTDVWQYPMTQNQHHCCNSEQQQHRAHQHNARQISEATPYKAQRISQHKMSVIDGKSSMKNQVMENQNVSKQKQQCLKAKPDTQTRYPASYNKGHLKTNPATF